MSRFTFLPFSSEKLCKNYFEHEAWAKNQLICGIDEVGRGCLAGPVVTAAVIIPPYAQHDLLLDSKVLAPQQRIIAAQWIMDNCWYGFGIINHRIIDNVNIYQATRLGMKRALIQASISCYESPSTIITDAMPLALEDTPYNKTPVYYFPHAEQLSSSIAAASIIAKVKRDILMDQLHSLFPGFSFNNHKGYATQKHQNALEKIKRSIIHRQSFITQQKKEKKK